MIPLIGGWITALISAGGYAAVMVLMALESACIPIPSELIMPFAGYLAGTGRFSLLGVALAGTIGCNLGSVVAYWVGAAGGRPFVARYGRYALVSAEDVDRAERFFARYGALSVLIGRMLPLVRTFIALPAGIGRMPQIPFHLYTFAGSFIWCLALAWIGRALGRQWNSSPLLHSVLHRLDFLVVVLIVASAAFFVWTRLRSPRLP